MKSAHFLAGVLFLVGLIVVLRVSSIGAEAGNNLPVRFVCAGGAAQNSLGSRYES